MLSGSHWQLCATYMYSADVTEINSVKLLLTHSREEDDIMIYLLLALFTNAPQDSDSEPRCEMIMENENDNKT